MIHQNQQMIQQNQQMLQQKQQMMGGGNGQIMGEVNGKKTILNNNQIVGILQKQQEEMQKLIETLREKDNIIERMLGET